MNSIVVLTCERCGKKTRNPETYKCNNCGHLNDINNVVIKYKKERIKKWKNTN